MCKLKGWTDKGKHYDVEMKGWMQKGGHSDVQFKRAHGQGKVVIMMWK